MQILTTEDGHVERTIAEVCTEWTGNEEGRGGEREREMGGP